MLSGAQLAHLLLPIGGLTKEEVRRRAAATGLRTAAKPDSQDVCFITRAGGGREAFLGRRIPLRPGRLVDRAGADAGGVDAVELVTVGQRRGLGAGRDGSPRYALEVDVATATVVVGGAEDLLVGGEVVVAPVWADDAARREALTTGGVEAQVSAHGAPVAVAGFEEAADGTLSIRWAAPQRRVAPGQSLVLYAGDTVLGGGTVARTTAPPSLS
jgi:tRNA-specific 2-thiouridylase